MKNKGIAWLVVWSLIVTMFVGFAPASYAEESDPIEIRTVADLYAINNNLAGNYILMNDIDLTEETKPDGRYSCNGHGWKPIGATAAYSDGNAFTGTFDGQGHTIKGMNIQFGLIAGNRYVGLFYDNSGLISNLSFRDVNISTSMSEVDNGKLYGGVLSAKNHGTIENVSVISGSISTYRAYYVGGLVGYASYGTIEGCTNNASIIALGYEENNIGGIIGYINQGSQNTIDIINCANSGNITVLGDALYSYYGAIGGIIGYDNNYYYHYNDGRGNNYYYYGNTNVRRCYNAGNIKANGTINDFTYLGGIVGKTDSLNENKKLIQNTYNTGSVVFDGTKSEGVNASICGIAPYRMTISSCYNIAALNNPIHFNNNIVCSNCYYIGDTTSTTTGATALTEAQLKDPDFMPGLDFDNTWFIDTDAEYPYPQLRSNPQDTEPRIDMIELTSAPTKQEYRTGDEISAAGGMLHVYYVDGTEKDVNVTEDMLSGYNMSEPGVQDVTISLKKHTVTYKISVTQRPEISNVTLYSGPDKTEFVRGTEFDFTGAVAHVSYVDGSSEDIAITADNTTGGDINQSGTYTITFEYQGFELTFEVKVVPLKITGLSIDSLPDKTQYVEGQELDPTGLVVAVHYNSGNSKELKSDDYTISYDNTAGEQTVTVSYQTVSATFKVLFAEKAVTDLTITKLPNKTQYIQTEPLDVTGMVVTAAYDNDTSEEVTGYSLSQMTDDLGYQTIVVSYGGKTAQFEVYVTEKKLSSIEITHLPDKVQYYVGDKFDPTGMVVKACYNDGTKEEVTDYATTSLPTIAGERTIAVTYQGLTAYVPVTVLENQATGIAVTLPTKTSYVKGEEFDPTGMQVTITYSNGNTSNVDDYTVSGFGEGEEENLITVTYDELSYSFIVTIHEPAKSWTVTKEATCSEEGIENLLCKNCGEVIDTRAIATLGHTAGDWETVRESTCSQRGLKIKKCSVCEEVLESEELPLADHTEGEWAVTREATCSAAGVKTLKCSKCGIVLMTEEIPTTDHTPGMWEVTKEPTCTETGMQRQACRDCGIIIKYKMIDKVDHSFGAWKTVKPAACTEEGSREKVCSECGEKMTETIGALGHDWGAWETIKEATVDEEGLERRVCSRDDSHVEENSIPKLDEETVAKTEATKEATSAIEQVDKLNEADYTAESYAAVKAAEQNLVELLKNENATSAQIKEATEALNNAVKALQTKEEAAANKVKKGDTYVVSANTYKVTKVASASVKGTVTLTKAKNAKTVTVPASVKLKDGKTYNVTVIGAKAFTGKKIRSAVIGTNVSKLTANAFYSSKATKVTIKTKKLKKTTVRKSLKGSKVKTVLVKVGTKKVNKTYVKKYKQIFTKKNAGRAVTVK